MPHGLPSMTDLSEFLKGHIVPENDAEQRAWEQVVDALEAGDHLEDALEGKDLPEALLVNIVCQTWNCVNEKDTIAYYAATEDPAVFPIGRVLEALFQSTNVAVHVVTTNYDRVIEYACNSAGLLFSTGFTPGYIQR